MFPVSRPRAARRRTLWVRQLSSSQTILTGAQGTAVDLLAPAELAGVGIYGGTIVRTHARIDVDGDPTDTNPGLTFAFGVFDSTVARPNPNTDLGSSYMWWDVWAPGSAPQSVTFSTTQTYGGAIDIRSQRSLPNFKTNFVMLSFNNGSKSITMSVASSVLIKLP